MLSNHKTIREMEVSNLNTESLKTSQSTYEFEDVAVELDDGTQIIVEGNAEISFDSKDDGIDGEDRIIYFIDSCDVNILTIWNDASEEISLNAEEMKLIQSEIENILHSQTVENY